MPIQVAYIPTVYIYPPWKWLN